MTGEPPAYLSYLLRLWRTTGREELQSGGEKAVWRASLESSLTHEIEGFRTLDELFAFLRRGTAVVPASEEGGSGIDGGPGCVL